VLPGPLERSGAGGLMVLRMSQAQFGLFQEQQRKGGGAGPKEGQPRQPRQRRRKDDLPENILEGQIKGFLESRGWILTRNHVGTFLPAGVVMRLIESGTALTKEALFRCMVRIGQKGFPDWTATRPVPGQQYRRDCFEFEAKAPGKRPSPEQRLCLEKRAAVGLACVWFDDFDGDWDTSFLPWYRERFA